MTRRERIGKLVEQVGLTEAGRELLKEIDAYGGYGRTVFNSDAAQNNFNQGKQSVPNWLHDCLKQRMNPKRKDEQ